MQRRKITLLGLAAGAPGSGKDTLFNQLGAAGYDVVNVKFADALTMETHEQFQGYGYMEFLECRSLQNLKDHPFQFFSINNLRKGEYRAFLIEGGHDPYEKRSARWHLIQYGTEFIRKHMGRDDYWLNQGLQAAHEAMNRGKVPVFTDVRFPNELKRLHNMGATSVFLLAPWSAKDGGIADGLIQPADCHNRFVNEFGNPSGLLENFETHYTMKRKEASNGQA